MTPPLYSYHQRNVYKQRSGVYSTSGACPSHMSQFRPAGTGLVSKGLSPAKVESVERDAVMLTHPPIPSLKWPEMTMEFKLPLGESSRLKTGDQIDIEFRMQQGDSPLITRIEQGKTSGAKK